MNGADVTHAMLKNIRALNVVVVHPQDQDGDELGAQLQRIGCKFQVFWPELDVLPVGTDLVLLAVRPETLSLRYPWMHRAATPPVIPILTFENPITLAAVLQLDAFTTIASPVRSAGLLTAIAVTMNQSKTRRARERYIERLEQKSVHHRIIQQATQIIMESRGLSEGEAYQLLRSQAMIKRESIESIASSLVKAQAALSF
ncbi:MAG: ANTAR domain-containing protein [Burkholderiales bacterium]